MQLSVFVSFFFFFFFNDTATTEIYTLSLHDALPIYTRAAAAAYSHPQKHVLGQVLRMGVDRKSTRLNSSHGYISYAVFCLKKKKKIENQSISDAQGTICEHNSKIASSTVQSSTHIR